jgi:hypothetical protein
MAKILGEAGRYVSQQSAKKSQCLVLMTLAGAGSISFLMGVFITYDLFIKKVRTSAALSIRPVLHPSWDVLQNKYKGH